MENRVYSPALGILAAIAIGFVLKEAAGVFLWVASSLFLFAALDPWIQRLNQRKIPPVLSALGLIAAATALLTGLGLLISHSWPDLAEQAGLYRREVLRLYGKVTRLITQVSHAWVPSSAAIPAPVDPSVTPVQVVDPSPLGGLGDQMLQGLGTAVTAVMYAVLTPILTFFIAAESKALGAVASRIFPDRDAGPVVWAQITQASGAFFLGNFLIAAASFPVFAVLFYAFGLKSALALALSSSVLNLIPFLGSLLSGAVPVLDWVANRGSLSAAVGLLGCCVAIHFLVANLVTPKVLGSKVSLNATASTIALIAWGELWGGVGLLLAIPLTATLRILFEHSGHPTLHGLALLMSDAPDSMLPKVYRRPPPPQQPREAEKPRRLEGNA